MECNLCKRPLDEPNDVLSEDICGQCLGCVILKERNYSTLAINLTKRILELEGRLKKISTILLDHTFSKK